MPGTVWSEIAGFVLLFSAALLVIAICTKDWSRLTAETSLWTTVLIDDYWGMWSWATVMTSGASEARLQFNYDWCGHKDTHHECVSLTLARVFAVACVALEAVAALCALAIECVGPYSSAPSPSSNASVRVAYVCVASTSAHMVVAVLALIAWSSVQDYLRAQDLTSGGIIDFGFSWYLVLVSAASTLVSSLCMLNHVWRRADAGGLPYTRISPTKSSQQLRVNNSSLTTR